MNDYELAIKNIIETIDTLHRHISDGTFSRPYWSINKIKELIDKHNKYRWHNLRKNPNDLPPNGMRVECQHLPNITTDKQDLVVMHYFIDGKFVYNWDVDTDIKSSTFGKRYYGDIIAWRKIEPFEVTE